jgi:hypothetical protein
MTMHRRFRHDVPFPARLKLVAWGRTIWRFVHDAFTMNGNTKKTNATAWRSNDNRSIESLDVMRQIHGAPERDSNLANCRSLSACKCFRINIQDYF